MGSAIVELSEEREVTTGDLKQDRELEHQLEHVERRMSVERATMDKLELEASRRAQELQEAQMKLTQVAAQVVDLR